MLHTKRALTRALVTTAAGAALTFGSLIGSAPAGAHVHVDAEDPAPGAAAVLTFRVPNESDTGSPTTALSVALPNLTSVSTAVMPGWTVRLDRDPAAGTVRSVTWTADPGGGVGRDQFGLFVLRATMPQADSVSFPATQTYADGTVVRWDQPPLPGGAEPEHPAPELALNPAAGGMGAEHDHPAPTAPATSAAPSAPAAAAAPAARPDNVARGLAGGALLVAALGVVIALVRRRA